MSKYKTCIALVKPESATAKEWGFGKLVYGIYEGDPDYSEEIRFGDGSWQRINDENRSDFLIIEQLGEDFLAEFFL